MTTDSTLDILRALRTDKIGMVGVVCALYADRLDELPAALENVRESALEYKGTLHYRRDRQAWQIASNVAESAGELLPAVRQMVERNT